VAAVGGAGEIMGVAADEGARDQAADIEGIAEPAGDGAQIIEAFEAEGGLMGSDLKDRIRRGVADRLAGPDVFLAELGDDRRPRGMLVAEDAWKAGLADELVGERGGKCG